MRKAAEFLNRKTLPFPPPMESRRRCPPAAHPQTAILSASSRSRLFLMPIATSAATATAASAIQMREFIRTPPGKLGWGAMPHRSHPYVSTRPPLRSSCPPSPASWRAVSPWARWRRATLRDSLADCVSITPAQSPTGLVQKLVLIQGYRFSPCDPVILRPHFGRRTSVVPTSARKSELQRSFAPLKSLGPQDDRAPGNSKSPPPPQSPSGLSGHLMCNGARPISSRNPELQLKASSGCCTPRLSCGIPC